MRCPQDSKQVLLHAGKELRSQNLSRAPRRSFPCLSAKTTLEQHSVVHEIQSTLFKKYFTPLAILKSASQTYVYVCKCVYPTHINIHVWSYIYTCTYTCRHSSSIQGPSCCCLSILFSLRDSPGLKRGRRWVADADSKGLEPLHFKRGGLSPKREIPALLGVFHTLPILLRIGKSSPVRQGSSHRSPR